MKFLSGAIRLGRRRDPVLREALDEGHDALRGIDDAERRARAGLRDPADERAQNPARALARRHARRKRRFSLLFVNFGGAAAAAIAARAARVRADLRDARGLVPQLAREPVDDSVQDPPARRARPRRSARRTAKPGEAPPRARR